ncbi:hypothetical protein ACCS64_38155, partial [Rhizobium ruizarguesonis]
VSNGAEPNISNLLSSGGAFNWGHYKSAEMDAALKEASSTLDPAAVRRNDAAGIVAQQQRARMFPEDVERHLGCNELLNHAIGGFDSGRV